jgi:hypothetical protein
MRKSISILFLLLLTSAASAQFAEPISTDKYFPVVLVDETDGYSPETEKKFGDTTITYCNITDGNTPSSYTDDATTWREIGNGTGEYGLSIGASEFATAGKRYLVKVVVAGCRTARFWVDTRTVDPALTATTSTGGSITVDPNGDAETVVVAVSEAAGLADTTDVQTACTAALDAQGYTIARAAYLDYVATLQILTNLFSEAATTVAVVTDAKEFTITAGSAVDDYYNQCMIIVQDASDADRRAVRFIRDYTGATKKLFTDEALPFLPAAGDPVYIHLGRAVGRGRVSP